MSSRYMLDRDSIETAKKLYNARFHERITDEQLAEACGISYYHFRNLKNPSRNGKHCKKEYLLILADKLNCNWQYLCNKQKYVPLNSVFERELSREKERIENQKNTKGSFSLSAVFAGSTIRECRVTANDADLFHIIKTAMDHGYYKPIIDALYMPE